MDIFQRTLSTQTHNFPLPPLLVLGPCGTFITIREPTVTQYRLPESRVYIRVDSWWCTPLGLDKCVMIRVYHECIRQSSFAALETLCALPTHASLPSALQRKLSTRCS